MATQAELEAQLLNETPPYIIRAKLKTVRTPGDHEYQYVLSRPDASGELELDYRYKMRVKDEGLPSESALWLTSRPPLASAPSEAQAVTSALYEHLTEAPLNDSSGTPRNVVQQSLLVEAFAERGVYFTVCLVNREQRRYFASRVNGSIVVLGPLI